MIAFPTVNISWQDEVSCQVFFVRETSSGAVSFLRDGRDLSSEYPATRAKGKFLRFPHFLTPT